jgi:transketolase
MKLVPGVEISTGALGVGLSVGVGVALDARVRGKTYRTFVMIGDGECDEGEIWEAAMSAAHFKLAGLTAILDCNGLQVDGATADIMDLSPMGDKWSAFGWRVVEIDGHDLRQIARALEPPPAGEHRPTMVIARTVKGKGISFVENRVEWHAGTFTPDQEKAAIDELS